MINWQWPSRQAEFWRSSKIWPLAKELSLTMQSILSDEGHILSHNGKLVPHSSLTMVSPSYEQDADVSDQVLAQLAQKSEKQAVVLSEGEWHLQTQAQDMACASWTEFNIEPDTHVSLKYTQENAANDWQIRVFVCHVAAGATLEIHSEIDSPGSKSIHIWVVNQQEGANLTFKQQHINFSYQREHVWVRLLGQQAHADLIGLYAAREQQASEQIWTLVHKASHTTSVQKMRGVVADRAHAVALSQVNVIPGIAKVDSVQKLDHILLSPKATVHTRPQLEILSDDVVCQHGVTVGELDDDSLFYLQSRAIDQSMAVRLLLLCFFEQIWPQLSKAMQLVVQQILTAKEKAEHDQLSQ